MPWFRIDDGWHSHPKVAGLSLAAAGLWAKAGSYCAQHLTDGFLAPASLRLLGGNTKLAAELVEVGLWVKVEKGWLFHEWLEHQPSREAVETKRKDTAERVRNWREKKRMGNAVTDGGCNAVSNAAPVPSRPVPLKEDVLRGREPERPIEPGSTADVLREWHIATATTGTPRGLFELVQACEQQAKAEKTTPAAIAKRAIAAFQADSYVQKQRAGFGLLVHQLDRWIAPPAGPMPPAKVSPTHTPLQPLALKKVEGTP